MAQINVRVDDNDKRLAEQACAELGLSMSTAINIFLKKVGREQRIPFEISVDPFYSEENMARHCGQQAADSQDDGGVGGDGR